MAIKRKYFRLFANCVPVKGYKRSIIYDLQTGKWDFVPNALYDILTVFGGYKVSECYKAIPKDQHKILDGYFGFLTEKGYLHLADKKSEFEQFPELDLTFEMPGIISNAILDFGQDTLNESNHADYEKAIRELVDLGCRYVQVRVFGRNRPNGLLIKLLSDAQYLDFEVEILLPFVRPHKISFYEGLLLKVKNINFIVVHGVPKNIIENDEPKKEHPIAFIHKRIDGDSCCGAIDPRYFTVNPLLFSESLASNTCLNRKIGIDANGFIKNCPSMPKKFARVGEGRISDIVFDKEFQSVWNIKKDDINICKLCEFRHMCTDCRAFVPGRFDKPLKCKYDPLTAKWAS